MNLKVLCGAHGGIGELTPLKYWWGFLPGMALSWHRWSPPFCDQSYSGVSKMTPLTAINSPEAIHSRLQAGRIPSFGPWLMLFIRPALALLAYGILLFLFTQFNVPNAAIAVRNWWSVYGTWTITDTGYAKTLGEIGKYSSGIEKHLVSENFVYEVKMKRKNTDEPNYVYFQAYPLPLSANKFWDDGYLFAYSNSGLFSLSRTVNGASTILATGSTDLIKPFDWNKISIKRGKSLMTIWINGNFPPNP